MFCSPPLAKFRDPDSRLGMLASHRSVSYMYQQTARRRCLSVMYAREDSNLQPRRYKLRALTIELRADVKRL